MPLMLKNHTTNKCDKRNLWFFFSCYIITWLIYMLSRDLYVKNFHDLGHVNFWLNDHMTLWPSHTGHIGHIRSCANTDSNRWNFTNIWQYSWYCPFKWSCLSIQNSQSNPTTFYQIQCGYTNTILHLSRICKCATLL